VLVAIIVVVVVALTVGAVVDLRARRRGQRIRGVDGAAVHDARRRNEADLRMRTNRSDYGSGWGGGSGF
jgi:hypothetical protein